MMKHNKACLPALSLQHQLLNIKDKEILMCSAVLEKVEKSNNI